MIKIHRITVIQNDNFFTVQGANRNLDATNEEEVQSAIKSIVTSIFNPPSKPERSTKPTVRHFRGGKEVSEEEAMANPLTIKKS